MLWTSTGPYRKQPFDKEVDLERAIKEVSTELFGPSRIYLDVKKKIGTSAKGNTPDAYLIDLSSPPRIRKGASARPHFSRFYPYPPRVSYDFRLMLQAVALLRPMAFATPRTSAPMSVRLAALLTRCHPPGPSAKEQHASTIYLQYHKAAEGAQAPGGVAHWVCLAG
jgi:hypothetical protein